MASDSTPMDAVLSQALSHTPSVIKRRSLSIFSRRGTDTPVSRIGSMNMRYGPPSTVGSKRWKSAKNKAETRRSGTILRAVPKAEAPTPAPLSSLEREMATSPNEEILNAIGRTSLPSDNYTFPVLPQNFPHSSRTYSVRASKFSPTRSRRERCSPKNSPDSESTIGVWKDGRVQWESEPLIPVVPNVSDAFVELDSAPIHTPTPTTKKNRRPRIQVIIPNDQRNRPFPSLPFFGHSGSAKTAALDTASSHEVSPPSGSSNTRVRNSVVSPISTQMPKPVRPFIFSSKKLDRIEQKPERPNSMHKAMPSVSSSSDDSQGEDDAHSSNYSKRSSMTSVEGDVEHNPTEVKPVSLHSRSDSPAFYISRPGSTSFFVSSPVEAGVFDDTAQLESSSDPTVQEVEICLQVPLPQPPQQPHLVSFQPPADNFSQYNAPERAELPATPVPSHSRRTLLIRRRSSSHSVTKKGHKFITPLDALDKAISHKDFAVNDKSAASAPSPTLSEAENDLEQQLTSITEDDPFIWDDIVSKSHPEGDNIYGPPPALPRKSSKRKSYLSPVTSRFSRLPSVRVTSPPQRKSSRRGSLPAIRTGSKSEKGKAKMLNITIPPMERRMSDDFTLSPLPEPRRLAERNISPQVAEGVILSILQSLESLDDLFATAVVNKGFYRVFKRHELSLMRSALRKMSPPAWEHREIYPPEYDESESDTAHSKPDYSPTTYLQYYMRDMYIIAALKSLILEQCQSFLRPETAAALASNDQAESSRVDDAFWRIWTFCKIFGCGKGREDDIVAQMDWLKGGVLVHQKTCRSTILTTDSFDITGAFASAPDCFAKGNENGLSAEQLYDMTELWTCLGVLLQGFEGRTEQARQNGVYEHTNVRGGDIDGEEVVLDEWYHYLLTLGLSAIVDLAAPSRLSDDSAFKVAAENGWMKWKMPEHGGSRKTFLKEAVSRVYEEKIASSFSSSSQKEMLKQMSKLRIQKHITEIRKRKNTGEYREIRMSQERPMSEWEGVFRTLTTTRPSQQAPHIPPMRYPPPMIALPPIPTSNNPNNRTVAMPLLPSPPAEDHPAFLQHPLQRDIFQSDAAENTADKAIYRIVEMGFTPDQARQALRMTDMGDGLRVDRAVELLLRA